MADAPRTTLALGVFDGVHAGHRDLIAAARERADRLGTPLIAVTFWPHPRQVVTGRRVPLLSTREARVELLRAAGADDVDVIEFTPQYSALTAREFVERELIARLHATCVVVGANFRFGAGAEGDVELLRALGTHDWDHSSTGMGTRDEGDSLTHARALNARDDGAFETVVCAMCEHEGGAVSSSRIRALIADEGDVAAAARLLGRAHVLDGLVVRGAQRGRELGFPTANLDHGAELVVPLDGVYAGRAYTLDGAYLAAISVGTNPQFTADDPNAARTVEAYLLDYPGALDSLYGEPLRIEFVQRVRGQQTYGSLDELIAAIRADVERVRELV